MCVCVGVCVRGGGGGGSSLEVYGLGFKVLGGLGIDRI